MKELKRFFFAGRLVAAPLHIAAISTGATLAVVLWVPPGPSAPRIPTLLLFIAILQVQVAEQARLDSLK